MTVLGANDGAERPNNRRRQDLTPTLNCLYHRDILPCRKLVAKPDPPTFRSQSCAAILLLPSFVFLWEPRCSPSAF